jgi:hypothetical protein
MYDFIAKTFLRAASLLGGLGWLYWAYLIGGDLGFAVGFAGAVLCGWSFANTFDEAEPRRRGA